MEKLYPILVVYATVFSYHFTALTLNKDISEVDEKEEIQ